MSLRGVPYVLHTSELIKGEQQMPEMFSSELLMPPFFFCNSLINIPYHASSNMRGEKPSPPAALLILFSAIIQQMMNVKRRNKLFLIQTKYSHILDLARGARRTFKPAHATVISFKC